MYVSQSLHDKAWLVCCNDFVLLFFFFFSSRRRHTRSLCDWSSDVCSSDLRYLANAGARSRMGPLQDIFETWARFLYEENATVTFLRRSRWLVLALSAAVLIPCFWHRRIEAGALGSHVYNAWLVQLIGKEQAPALY